MIQGEQQRYLLQEQEDLCRVMMGAKGLVSCLGFSQLQQTMFLTAVKELARNILKFTPGGEVLFVVLSKGELLGVKAVFIDHGPGVDDLGQVMSRGYSSVGSLGVGLGGVQRLVDEVEVWSPPGKGGLEVSIISWKHF